MKVVDFIREVSKLNPTEKQRILNHFKILLNDSRPTFQEINEKKAKDGLCCVLYNAKNVIRFGKFPVKIG